MARAGLDRAPATPLNVAIGPHRRYTWVDASVDEFKAIKNALGGTLNDVVLSAVALALGRWLRGRGVATEGLVLKAMVPVSVRADAERGALGNRVAAMWAPLPVGLEDPTAVYAEVHAAMQGLKESGQAVGAQALTQLADFAPPTIMSQAARLQARQRYFNLVVTNVPGPQVPLYLLGHELLAIYPVVPLARNQALGVAIMSYNGRLGFGLLGDFDALPDLADVADALRAAIAELREAAGLTPPAEAKPARARRTRRSTAAAG
jgi:WS/DGAT/MGAT family acyltransferase